MKSRHCSMRGKIDLHFAGAITSEDERTMRGHLVDCSDCGSYYRRRLLLSKLDPAALGPEERIGRGLGLYRARRSVVPFVAAGFGVVLAAAALVLFVGTRAGGADDGRPSASLVTARTEGS